MNRSRCATFALLVAELIAAPLVTIVSYVLRWPLHLSNSRYFIHYVFLLQVSALTGLFSGGACAVTGCRPRASPWLAAAIMFLFLGAPELVMAVRGTLPPAPMWRYAGDVVACSLRTRQGTKESGGGRL